jgi:hypothetical protein
VVIDKNGKVISPNQNVSGQVVYIVNETDQPSTQPVHGVSNQGFERDEAREE